MEGGLFQASFSKMFNVLAKAGPEAFGLRACQLAKPCLIQHLLQLSFSNYFKLVTSLLRCFLQNTFRCGLEAKAASFLDNGQNLNQSNPFNQVKLN